MHRLFFVAKRFALGLSLLVSMGAAQAALDIGEVAPDFTVPASLSGNTITFTLSQALRKGPVVLYFFPAAFSVGCSIEAHAFAEAIADFESVGATVVGMSGDDINTLVKFSMQDCRGQFVVASDQNKTVMKSYDAVMASHPDFANRISYVIAPDSTVIYQYTSLNPGSHVKKVLAAVREWVTAHPTTAKKP